MKTTLSTSQLNQDDSTILSDLIDAGKAYATSAGALSEAVLIAFESGIDRAEIIETLTIESGMMRSTATKRVSEILCAGGKKKRPGVKKTSARAAAAILAVMVEYDIPLADAGLLAAKAGKLAKRLTWRDCVLE